MFTKTNEDKIQFRGGMFGLVFHFIVLFIGIILLSVSGKACPWPSGPPRWLGGPDSASYVQKCNPMRRNPYTGNVLRNGVHHVDGMVPGRHRGTAHERQG